MKKFNFKSAFAHSFNIFFIACASLLALSCDSDSSEKIAVEINPRCVELLPGESQQFNATIFINGIIQDPNPDNSAVSWEVEEGNINGTISAQGLYQAPDVENLPDEVLITATSLEDSQKQNQASVLFAGNCPE